MKKYSLSDLIKIREEVKWSDASKLYAPRFCDRDYLEPAFIEMPSMLYATIYFLLMGFDIRVRAEARGFDVVQNSTGEFLRVSYLEGIFKNGMCLFAVEKDGEVTDSYVVFIKNDDSDRDFQDLTRDLGDAELLDTVVSLWS